MEKRSLRREGFRFWLRPFEESDGEAVFDAAIESVQRVGAWLDWLTPSYTVSDSIGWAKNASDDWGKGANCEFVIIDSLDGSVSGCAGLNHINDLFCNLGYWVRESKVRQGAAFEAAQLLREFGHGELGLQRLEIVIADGNAASRAVAEKLGAVYEGKQRMRGRIGGRACDAHMYALLAASQTHD